MDPVKKIEALEAKRDALEAALAAPGIDKDREIAIRNQVTSIGAEITMWVSKLPSPLAADNKAAADAQAAADTCACACAASTPPTRRRRGRGRCARAN